MADTTETAAQTRSTVLHGLHVELGGKMVPFAGWELPIQYEGVIAEHLWCRSNAALFDVSHMGVVELRAGDAIDGATQDLTVLVEQLESLTPASVATIEPGRQRYGLLTNDDGGVIDDLIITNRGDHIMLVVNAARREVDLGHLRGVLTGIDIVERNDLALIALQGPKAVDALGRLAPGVGELVFLDFKTFDLEVGPGRNLDSETATTIESVGISRSGYTGEDGFEILVPVDEAERVARVLLNQPEVKPAGLGARDTLRLEAGLALYGNDLDETTSPVEANLTWTMPKRRREDARFLGAKRILTEFADGPSRRRVGIRPDGRRPVRDGALLQTLDGAPAGVVTSGGYGPSIEGPVAMGYVATDLATTGQQLIANVRGTDVPVAVADLPFSPHNYNRGAS